MIMQIERKANPKLNQEHELELVEEINDDLDKRKRRLLIRRENLVDMVRPVCEAIVHADYNNKTRLLDYSRLHFKFDIELHARNAGLLLARDVDPVDLNAQLRDIVFELVLANAEVNELADEHVATDAAENVEIEGLHKIKG